MTGNTALGNHQQGISITGGAANNTVGGLARPPTPGTGAGNVVSANGSSGVGVTGAGSNNNVVAGNILGLNAAGTAILGNNFQGALRPRHLEQYPRWHVGRRGQHHLGQRLPVRHTRRDRDPRRHDEQSGPGQLHRHRHHRHDCTGQPGYGADSWRHEQHDRGIDGRARATSFPATARPASTFWMP